MKEMTTKPTPDNRDPFGELDRGLIALDALTREVRWTGGAAQADRAREILAQCRLDLRDHHLAANQRASTA
jgi:hypothetical protein